MKTVLAALAIVSLTLAAAQPAAAQFQPRPRPHRALSLDELTAVRTHAESELMGGVTALLIAVLGLGGGALATGLASEHHADVCTPSGSGFFNLSGLGTPPCDHHNVVVGHDTALLFTSIAMASAGLLTLIIGAAFIHSGRERLRGVHWEEEARSRVSFGASADGAVATFELTF